MPRAGVEPARPFSGKRRILSPQCLPISPSGRRLRNAHLRHSVTRAAHARNAHCMGSQGSWQHSPCLHQEKREAEASLTKYGAGKESRTLDLNLGKVALYQLSYSRILLYYPDVSIGANQQASNYITIFWLCILAHQKIHQSPCIHDHDLPQNKGLKNLDASGWIWRREPESNWSNRICNPGHNRFAIAPGIRIPLTKKGSNCFPFYGNWSGKRVSNSRPQPWQGCALPTELFPHLSKPYILQRLLRWNEL